MMPNPDVAWNNIVLQTAYDLLIYIKYHWVGGRLVYPPAETLEMVVFGVGNRPEFQLIIGFVKPTDHQIIIDL